MLFHHLCTPICNKNIAKYIGIVRQQLLQALEAYWHRRGIGC